MRTKKYFAILSICTFLIACGSENNTADSNAETTESTENSQNQDLDLKGMKEVSLVKQNVEAAMYIPDGSKGKVNITETEWGSVIIDAGKNYGLEVVPFGLTVSEKKAELEGDQVFEIEYIEEDDDLLFYKKSIANSEIEAEYHFFMNKEINGEIYEIKSLNDRNFKEKAVAKMIQSANTLKPKSAA